MLATGKAESTVEGTPLEALNFTQGSPADPPSHRTIGADFPPAGIGAPKPIN